MNKFILSIMALLTCSLGSCGQHGFKTVDADEFEREIASDSVQLVDVRTAGEFAEGHIAAGRVVNIDVKTPDFAVRADELLDKGKTVAVYCRSGKRSAYAAGQLVKSGFRVINLDGGILAWRQKGKPVAR